MSNTERGDCKQFFKLNPVRGTINDLLRSLLLRIRDVARRYGGERVEVDPYARDSRLFISLRSVVLISFMSSPFKQLLGVRIWEVILL